MKRTTPSRRRRLLTVAITTALLCAAGAGVWPTAASAASVQYYVSVTGSDSNTGTLSSPFATIQRCAAAVSPGDTCMIRGGTYRETVTPPTSGSSGLPITFRAYAGERVVVSGANRVTSTWTNYSGQIYRTAATLPVSTPGSTGIFANQLFVNDAMLNEARWPNASPTILTQQNMASAQSGTNATTLVNSSIPAIPGGWAGGTAYFRTSAGYVAESGRITAGSGTTLTIDSSTQDTAHCPTGCLGNGSKFFLYGKLAALDSPGEWFYDPSAKYLYVWSPTGGAPTGVEYKARNDAFDLSARSYVNVDGIDTIGSTIRTDGTSTNNNLNDLSMKYLSHYMTVPFDASKPYGGIYEYAHMSDTGVMLNGSANSFTNSTIYGSAGNGITVSGNSQKIVNNLIQFTDYGMLYNAGIRAESLSTGLQIRHNTVAYTGRDAIIVSSNEADRQAWKDNDVSYNDIFAHGQLNADLGGIYLCCSLDLTGTRIHHNTVHDANSQTAAIYLDAGTGKGVVDHNVTWGGGSGLFLNTFNSEQGTGTNYANNKVYNNTITNGYATSNTGTDVITNNILSSTRGTATMSNNLVAPTDPLYVNATNRDYRLTSGSPAVNAGASIPNITTNAVGPPDVGAYELGAPDFSTGCSLPGCSSELALNGDFESGSTSSWCNAYCANASVTTSTPGQGSYSGRVGAAGSAMEQLVSGLTPDTSYTLRFRGRVDGAGDEVWIGAKAFGGQETKKSLTNTSWTDSQISFVTGPTATSARIYIWKQAGSGNGYGDQISLRPTPAPESNLLSNGGFETGDRTGWCNGTYCTGTTVTSAAARSGAFGLSTPSSSNGIEQRVVGLQAGTQYTVSGYARVSNTGSEIWVGAKSFGRAETHAATSATGWTPISTTFTTGPQSTTAIIYIWQQSGTSPGFADDLTLRPAGAPALP